MDTQGKLLLSPREAARALSISERTLWSLTDRGEIPCIHIGSAKRYPVHELERFIASRTHGSNDISTDSSSSGSQDGKPHHPR